MKKFWFLALILIGYVTTVYMVYFFESQAQGASITTLTEAFWYSLVTLTTVGYGVYSPVTPFGRLVGAILILSSLGILGYFIGKLTEHIQSVAEKRKMGLEGTQFKQHVIIVGWSDFTYGVLTQVINAGKQACVLTDNKDHIDIIYNLFDRSKVFVICADYTTTDLLSKAGAPHASSLMPCLGDDTKNLVFVINAKKSFPHLSTVVTIDKIELKDTFTHAGVDFVISQNEVSSKIVASYVFEPIVARFSEDILASTCSEDGYDIKQFYVTDQSHFVGLNFGEIFSELRDKHNVVAIGLGKHDNGLYELLKLPANDTPITVGDYVLVMSSGTATSELEKIFGSSEGIHFQS